MLEGVILGELGLEPATPSEEGTLDAPLAKACMSGDSDQFHVMLGAVDVHNAYVVHAAESAREYKADPATQDEVYTKVMDTLGTGLAKAFPAGIEGVTLNDVCHQALSVDTPKPSGTHKVR